MKLRWTLTKLESIKRGMKLVMSGESLCSASCKANICHETLAKYLKAYPGITSYAVKDISLIPSGRPPYLSEESMEALKPLDYPINYQTAKEAIYNLKKKREEHQSDPAPPVIILSKASSKNLKSACVPFERCQY